jgi:hypothetical protein
MEEGKDPSLYRTDKPETPAATGGDVQAEAELFDPFAAESDKDGEEEETL